ncbi:MAG TPA: sigma-54-dependent Fis family transcriptional regulator [Aquifex aeolicus]|nr:sigma-54-dependent Fis family transcriptional regulator [Aquifex aeolicus]
MKPKVLIVDDDISYLNKLKKLLEDDYEILTATNLKEAFNKVYLADVVLLDLNLNENKNEYEGFIFLEKVKKDFPELPIVVVTGYYEADKAVKSFKLGAYDFIEKGTDINKLFKVIKNALEKLNLELRLKNFTVASEELEPFDLVGVSEHIKELRKTVDFISKDAYLTILIIGETGTGKELVARLIHKKGLRKNYPFIPVSLASIPKDLAESELFGYEKGAFTGATEKKKGLIEMANKGILYLDDIDYAGLEVQVKLLRFLEERKIRRLGGNKEIDVDVQIISSTNKDLKSLISEGKFREDLFYRISVFTIEILPLRKRKEDIPVLINYFLELYKKKRRTSVKGISDKAMDYLVNYNWPGNVRELKNLIERLIILAQIKGKEIISEDMLPQDIRNFEKISSTSLEFPLNLDYELAKYEMDIISKALEESNFSISKAYKLLGLKNRYQLYYRLKRINKLFPELVKTYKKTFSKIKNG